HSDMRGHRLLGLLILIGKTKQPIEGRLRTRVPRRCCRGQLSQTPHNATFVLVQHISASAVCFATILGSVPGTSQGVAEGVLSRFRDLNVWLSSRFWTGTNQLLVYSSVSCRFRFYRKALDGWLYRLSSPGRGEHMWVVEKIEISGGF